MASRTPLRIAIIGGGWAGIGCRRKPAATGPPATHLGSQPHLGGPCRALTVQGPQGQHWTLDNGQHILIGAYSACLQAMRTVGVQPDQALQRLPLDLRYADGTGLQLPHLPPPWDAVIGIAQHPGLELA